MQAAQSYSINGWTVDFRKHVHMYSHDLKLSRGDVTYQVLCEDTPSGHVGVWPYTLKETDDKAIFQEVLGVLRQWLALSHFPYLLYSSPTDYETNDEHAKYLDRVRRKTWL